MFVFNSSITTLNLGLMIMKFHITDFVLHLIRCCKFFIVMQNVRTGFYPVIVNFRAFVEYQNIVSMLHCGKK